MSTYSKKERNEIYRRALQMLEHEIEIHLCTYICPNLISLIGHRSLQTELPEFYEQKPPNTFDSLPWWGLDDEGNEKRKQVLLNAIELTNE